MSFQLDPYDVKFQVAVILIVGVIAITLVAIFVTIPFGEAKDQQKFEIRNTVTFYVSFHFLHLTFHLS